MYRIISSLLIFSLLFVLVSCGQKVDDGSAGTEGGSFTFASVQSYDLSGQAVQIAGIEFTPPKEWNDLGPSGMRKASYTFGPIAGEADSATMTVFYFGPSGGGTIEANLDRWILQMATEDGSDPHTIAVTEQQEHNGLPMHLLTLQGTYNASTGGMAMGGNSPRDKYVMLGAVVEAPEGNVFFKMTGPDKTGNAMAAHLMGMLKEGVKKL